MRPRLGQLIAAGLVALFAGSCDARMVAVRTGPGDGDSCPLLGIDGVLRGDAAAGARVWLETDEGTRYEVIWPDGFGARFSPGLELLGPLGGVFAREGDRIYMLGLPEDERVWMACGARVVRRGNP